MVRKQITTEQIEKVKEWKDDFVAQATDEGAKYIHEEHKHFINAEDYCNFLGLDEHTVNLLGVLGYAIHYSYSKEEGKYILKCDTYIDGTNNERLSVELEDSTDYLGLYTKVGVARWLPSNWKELMSDEQKEEIAKEWCKENSVTDLLSDSDKEEIAYDYMDENSSECANHSFEKMGSCDQRDFIKECIDNL